VCSAIGKRKKKVDVAMVADQIITALADYLKRDKKSIQLNHTLREDLGLDSMSTIELVYQIEEVFDLEVPNEDLTKLTTVGSVVEYVENRLNISGQTQAASSAASKQSKS
jgi:acyl carrier protein